VVVFDGLEQVVPTVNVAVVEVLVVGDEVVGVLFEVAFEAFVVLEVVFAEELGDGLALGEGFEDVHALEGLLEAFALAGEIGDAQLGELVAVRLEDLLVGEAFGFFLAAEVFYVLDYFCEGEGDVHIRWDKE
jgi:hypothetical protein